MRGLRWVLWTGWLAASVVHSETPLAQALPKGPPAHIVLVIMENHAPSQIIGSAAAPYINGLARRGAYFTQSFGVAHPSQPNYLALFSGSTHGVRDDRCPLRYWTQNLAQQLITGHKSFVGYSEGLPSPGYTGCSSGGGYARKHAPWVNFPRLPATVNQPYSAFPRADFNQLPTVAFVVPSLADDMHDGSVGVGDAWLKVNMDDYVKWATNNNSLLIVTWDEDDGKEGNHIATLFVGPMVKSGTYARRITHFDVLRTIEALADLAPLDKARSASTILEIW